MLVDEFEVNTMTIASLVYHFMEEVEVAEVKSLHSLQLSASNVVEGQGEGQPNEMLNSISSESYSKEAPSEKSISISTGTDLASIDKVMNLIRAAYLEDQDMQGIIYSVEAKHRRLPLELVNRGYRLELGECSVIDGMVYIGRRLLVPNKGKIHAELLSLFHGSTLGGHAGRTTTFARISEWYYWSKMLSTVARYTTACKQCRRSKPFRKALQGLLKPLPIPERYW
jgi:hypothetical protein